jgi:class 3 adenylate cyclase
MVYRPEAASRLAEIAFRHDGTIFNRSGDSLMIGDTVNVAARLSQQARAGERCSRAR